ncbi:solute carrier family 45 member 4 [Leptonychotes weddellii]|uniref:Solute carrier family 45 member 4 n=1 Tax=Leptonychotes weddellii TaxID=9713 RepID=A0A2U3Y707_LEPWE|nr:solute carrier family 45 member 4 [Leptonychotes weddellii]
MFLVVMRMAPQNADSESLQVQEFPVPLPDLQKPGSADTHDETISEGSIDRIPVRLWVMHGAVMFGREFCYAMETALVTPILLQIGLPEQYYSLTWFLSPILGLIFTPIIGSASDRCTLSWGRRRPFILALCVGVLFGVALFLNGSAIGLSLGDVPNRQPIGIVLTVLGVVVLDFSADATEGPIRAYLLDVVDSEEQDMALNIHAFSAVSFLEQAPSNSTSWQAYNAGVKMGCWGLVIYAATGAICSALLQKYLDNYDLSIRVIYVLGTLGFSIGTAVMAMFANVYVAMIMISTMGIVSMSISYCPYALLGQYHDIKEYVHHSPGNSRRGFGIDCAILSCQVYISQILVASALGGVVDAVGSVRVIPVVASVGSFLGFLTATFLVIYPEVSEEAKEEQKGLSRQPSGDGGDGGQKPTVLTLSRKQGPQGLVETESVASGLSVRSHVLLVLQLLESIFLHHRFRKPFFFFQNWFP